MPPLTIGQRFESLQAFKTSLRAWAIEENFTSAILDSDSRRVRAGCRSSPNCPFKARCNFSERRGFATVTTLHDVHTCRNTPLNTDSQVVSRAETSRLKFLIAAVPQLLNLDEETTPRAIIDAVKAKYGQEINLRQAQKVKASLCPRSSRKRSRTSQSHQRDGQSNRSSQQRQGSLTHLEIQDDATYDSTTMALDPQIDEQNDVDSRHEGVQVERPFTTQTHAERQAPASRWPSLEVGRSLIASAVPSPSEAIESRAHQPMLGSPGAENVLTPQEIRLEAAALFQRAAEKLGEAALLHAEATRLFSSVANS